MGGKAWEGVVHQGAPILRISDSKWEGEPARYRVD